MTINRRNFLKAGAATSVLAGMTVPTIHAAENNTIRFALIGCGGRGRGAAYQGLSTNQGPVKLVALADAFPSHAQGFADMLRKERPDQVDLPEDRVFDGLDAYKKVIDCLDKSGFSEKLAELPKSIDSFVYREFDEEGVYFSGGEEQKIVISRVFYKPCHIIIMDEPSSALDPIAEYELNQKMMDAAHQKTVIFISHRLSTTRNADKIFMLEKGRIIEEGTHDELIALNGKYAEMFNMQAEKYLA